MKRGPGLTALLRVVPLILLFVAILVLKQRCGDSTAKLFDVVAPTPGPSAPPAPGPDLADRAAPRQ